MAELNVEKSSIYDLFSTMKGKFIIPNYQRPYAWEAEDHCLQLWDDIIDFYDNTLDGNSGDAKIESDKEYFLGSIVVSTNRRENSSIEDYEVVDGQQRLTSILLLLRAIYARLEKNTNKNDTIDNLKAESGKCIWFSKPMEGTPIKNEIRVETLIATDSEKADLKQILIDGNIIEGSNSSYNKNYRFFVNKIGEFIGSGRELDWRFVIMAILKKIVIFPIKCERRDLALKIFLTINDRGMDLSPADLIKSALIEKLKDNKVEIDALIVEWNELVEVEKKNTISMDKAFRHYSFVVRYANQDNGNEISMQKFFMDKDEKRLYTKNVLSKPFEVMEAVKNIALFWDDIANLHVLYSKKHNKVPTKAFKYLHCLNQLPSDRWQEVVSIYYNNTDKLDGNFVIFIHQLLAYIGLRYLFNPSVKSFFNPIYADTKDCLANIVARNEFNREITFKNMAIKDGFTRDKIIQALHEISLKPKVKLYKPLIYIYCYLNQDDHLIPSRVDIEHIFPKNHNSKYFAEWFKGCDNKDSLIECFGNKVLLEKKLNIQANNGYWDKKREYYNDSSITEVLNLAKNQDWTVRSILERNDKIVNDLANWFCNELNIK